jgi:hypothetical protein
VLSTNKSLLARHDGRGVSKKRAVFGGTKTALFVSPFEKNLLIRMDSELDFLHSTVHEECKKLITFSLMNS